MSSNESRQAPPPAVARLLGDILKSQRAANVQLLSEGLSNFSYRVDFDCGAGPAVTGQFLNEPHAIPEYIDCCLASPAWRVRIDERGRDRVHTLAWSRAQGLACLRDETYLVHGDFSNRNILVRREQDRWRAAAVLDWEFALSGSPLFDIASFLRYERSQTPSREPHFSHGYKHGGGNLPEDSRRLARVIDLTRLCEILMQEELPEPIAAEVAGLVQETIEDDSTDIQQITKA